MFWLLNFIFCLLIVSCYTAPVRKSNEDLAKLGLKELDYQEYLEEVMKELENDKDFMQKVQHATEHNRTDHISQSLLFVNHRIRNKLDELKRKEVDRLNILEKELERRKLEAQGARVPPPERSFKEIINVDKEHMDHKNPNTFEIADLKKLIEKAEKDLLFIDKAQEMQYKEHEMKKDFLKKKKLESLKTEEEKKKFLKDFEESQKRHNDHPKIHQPGSSEQMKEVWEKTDHLDPKEFNPKTFFDIHDINADGHLDINEVEAMMQMELSKVYEANNTDDDMQERYHEMVRMRTELLKLMDTNKDGLISKTEFIDYTASEKYKEDPEWKTAEESNQKPYTEGEYKEFEDSLSPDDDEDDEFSDQMESLQHIPNLPLNQPHETSKHDQQVPPKL